MADKQLLHAKTRINIKKLLIRVAIVLVLVGLVIMPLLCRRQSSLLAVHTTVVKRGDIDEYLSLEARLVPKEIQKVMANGQTVLQVHVEEGDEVRRGQLLLTLDMSELEKTLEERKQALEEQKKLQHDLESLMLALKGVGDSLDLGQVSKLTGSASELLARLNRLVASWQKITNELPTMDTALIQDSLKRVSSILSNADDLMGKAAKFISDIEKEVEQLKGSLDGHENEATLRLLEILRDQLLWMRSMLVSSETVLEMAGNYLSELLAELTEQGSNPSLIESVAALSSQLDTSLAATKQLVAQIDRLLKDIDALIKKIEKAMKQPKPTPSATTKPASDVSATEHVTASPPSTPTSVDSAEPTSDATSTEPSTPPTVDVTEPTTGTDSIKPVTESPPSTSNGTGIKIGRARLQAGGIDSLLFSLGTEIDILSLLTSGMGQYGQLKGLVDNSVEAAEKALAEATPEVRADFDGTIVHLNVKEGDQPSPFSSQTPLLEVYKHGDYEAVFQANENDAYRLSKGDKVNYLFAGTAFHGEIIYKAPIAESASNLLGQSNVDLGGIFGTIGGLSPTVTVRMSVEGDDLEKLTPGFNIRADIEIGHKIDVLTIPVESLIRDRGRDCVLRLSEKDVVNIVPVTIGLQSATAIEVVAGLDAGDTIAVSPNPDIKDGSRVTVKTHTP
ncbi:MAG TPA: biotin/lipoyl-binding protein [Clostridiaceae bacterium]|nr:biotin/lipoyl-binding protein [Clostridiaceae bacterium]